MLTSYGGLRMRGYKLPPFNITKNENSQCNFSICNLCSQQSQCHPSVTGKFNITLPSTLKPVTGSLWKEAIQWTRFSYILTIDSREYTEP